MSHTIALFSEVIVLVFNILIFMKLMVPKKESPIYYTLMYVGSAIILITFFTCTYFGILPEALGSFICVTIPTFILYFALSKYKDFRFFVTFCFLDTITLAIVAISRCIGIIGGEITETISSVLVCTIMFFVYFKGNGYFKRYRELMSAVEDGWGITALSTAMIYIMLVLSASYPVPLIKRPEYLPVYVFMVLTVLSFHTTFLMNLLQKKRLSILNEQLIEEKKWHKIAYVDALTEVKNKMAYMENVNNLERNLPRDSRVSVIMIDIDNFKNVNDTMGHKSGDELLKNVATALKRIFFDSGCVVYRVGGDEFVVIALDIDPEFLKSIVDNINETKEFTALGYSVSIGYSDVDLYENNAFERALARADEKMYQMKEEKRYKKKSVL